MKVYIRKGKSPYKTTKELLDAMKFSIKGKRVFIKANVHPAKIPSTDVNVIRAVVDRLKNCEIVVGGNVGIMGESFTINNYHSLESMGVRLVDLDLDEKVMMKVKKPIRYRKIPIAKSCIDCDYFINVSKLKIHNHAKVTLCLKNLFGCVPGTAKLLMHPYINDAIHDYMQVINSDFNIIDGIVGCQNDEFYVKPMRSNIVIGGHDALSVDVVGSKCMEVEPSEVEYLRLLNYEKRSVEVVGEKIDDVMREYDRRKRPIRIIRNFMEKGILAAVRLNLISR
jgi:uncharacterized protein (DUF362 family)